MNLEKSLDILRSNLLTEKVSLISGQYAFKVTKEATKVDIKKAIEALFNVKVKAVNVTNVKSKPARFGRILGKRRGWKKAYVILQPGEKIDLATAE